MTTRTDDIRKAAARLSAEATRPLPGSRKIHVTGSRPDLRVPMRAIAQSPTLNRNGGTENPAIPVYDTSGPYTDPDARIDLLRGVPALRDAWIEERGDTERLPGPSSEYGRQRRHDAETAALRFGSPPRPRRAREC